MDFGKLIVRLVVGGFFVGHGMQKLRGAFGGPGLEGTEQMMTALSMHPAKVNARAAALSETIGGAGIALGAGTPFAAAALIGTMATAVRKVHAKNGPWNSAGGWEYNAVLMSVVAGLTNDGPGDLSFDRLIGRTPLGPRLGRLRRAGGPRRLDRRDRGRQAPDARRRRSGVRRRVHRRPGRGRDSRVRRRRDLAVRAVLAPAFGARPGPSDSLSTRLPGREREESE